MVKKQTKKQKTASREIEDVNQIAFRVVQESTSEDKSKKTIKSK